MEGIMCSLVVKLFNLYAKLEMTMAKKLMSFEI